jgi:hypothetical protein
MVDRFSGPKQGKVQHGSKAVDFRTRSVRRASDLVQTAISEINFQDSVDGIKRCACGISA